jgi:hypothetical protein
MARMGQWLILEALMVKKGQAQGVGKKVSEPNRNKQAHQALCQARDPSSRLSVGLAYRLQTQAAD